MNLTMYQVDAFTDKLFEGNSAAVLYLEDWLPDALMQQIAMENNLAETAVVVRTADRFDIRWFTPTNEAAFCGHATLAAAHVLMTEYGIDDALHFGTRDVGQLEVTKTGSAYTLDLPSLPPEPATAVLTDILGTEPIAVFRNFENLFAVLQDAGQVRSFVPALAKIAELARLGFGGFVITAQGDGADDADFVSRYFAPQSGIPEDPVTGSTHASLVPYWAGALSKNSMIAYQLSSRGGRLLCSLQGDRVKLSGAAVTFMEATIRLPAR